MVRAKALTCANEVNPMRMSLGRIAIGIVIGGKGAA
jgi:hypothetical protein